MRRAKGSLNFTKKGWRFQKLYGGFKLSFYGGFKLSLGSKYKTATPMSQVPSFKLRRFICNITLSCLLRTGNNHYPKESFC